MAKEILQLGNSANDGTGDSLRAGGTKVNANFTELYDSLGGTAGATASLISTASPNLSDALTWNGTSFSPGIPKNKGILEQNLNELVEQDASQSRVYRFISEVRHSSKKEITEGIQLRSHPETKCKCKLRFTILYGIYNPHRLQQHCYYLSGFTSLGMYQKLVK